MALLDAHSLFNRLQYTLDDKLLKAFMLESLTGNTVKDKNCVEAVCDSVNENCELKNLPTADLSHLPSLFFEELCM